MSDATLAARTHDEQDDERGFVLVWLAIVLVLLLSIAAFAVDLVHAYAEAQRVQNAVDAAALAGASQIPADLTGDAAKIRVKELLKANGFDTDDPACNCTLVENAIDGNNPNQMNVQMRLKFDTYFARIMGFSSLSVRRTAYGQYDAKVAMGSPANNIGDVPTGNGQSSCQDLFAAWTSGTPCASIASNAKQDLYASIQGKYTNKFSGNAYSTEHCPDVTSGVYISSSVIRGSDACDGSPGTGGANKEYSASGEYFTVHNDIPGQDLVIAVYDAGFVHTTGNCSNPIGGTDPARYVLSGPYCAGDITQPGTQCNFSGLTPPIADCGNQMNTKFDVLAPDDTPNDPSNNPIQGCKAGEAPWDIPGEAVNATFPPTPLAKTATVNDGTGNPTTSFPNTGTINFLQHWKVLCTISTSMDPARQDWIVRVNAPNGQGTNNFSILALHDTATPPTRGITVSTRQRLPLFAVKPTIPASAEFFVANIKPAARDRQLIIELYDFGDSAAGSQGSLELVPYRASVPSQGDKFACSYTKPPGTGPEGGAWDPKEPWDDPANEVNLTLPGPGCKIDFNTLDWNGQWVTIKLTIPGTASGGYTCTTGPLAQTDDCWIKMKINLTVGALADATTWNARLSGAPVRLVK
jgi:Flp pilus assembly protein TadG